MFDDSLEDDADDPKHTEPCPDFPASRATALHMALEWGRDSGEHSAKGILAVAEQFHDFLTR